MFESIDYIVTVVLRDKLLFLSQNPHHAEFIFQGYSYPHVKEYLDSAYILDAVKYVTDNQLYVAPAYQLEKAKKPGLFVSSTGDETDLYIGDYGSTGSYQIVEPQSLFQFTISGVIDRTLKVSKLYNIGTKLKSSSGVRNNMFLSAIDSFYEDDSFSYVTLKDAPPSGLDMRGWHIMSSARYMQCKVASSTDTTKIQLELVTNGDVSIHKLFRAIVKYAIKSSRPVFDAYGLQVSSVSVSPISVVDPTDVEWVSVFTVSGKFTESWIESETPLPNELVIQLLANSCDPQNETVILSSEL